LASFFDVLRTNAYWADIQLVSTRGIMNGKTSTNFGVADSLDRAQAAIVLVRLLGLPTDPAPTVASFADVPTTHYAFKYIEALKAAGITKGCGGTPANYCPDTAIKRVEFSVLLVNGLKLDISSPPAAPYYQDLPSSQFGFAQVQVATQDGLVQRCSANPDRFCPTDPLGRGDVATIAARTLVFRSP
jgi:hypothetical protein